MRIALTWLRGLIAAQRSRLIATALGVAIAVALLASLGGFLGRAKATMTARAARSVAVDWQVEVTPNADPGAVLAAVQSTPHVVDAVSVGFATSPGLQATLGGTTQTTGAAVIVGLPERYQDTFAGSIRALDGATTGVLLPQQTASNLRVRPGGTFSINRTGLAPLVVRVDGIIELPQADSLFQQVGAPAGAAAAAPPDNVVLLPAVTFTELVGSSAGTTDVHTQVHVHLDRHLPSDPASAYRTVTGAARNLELQLAGAGHVGDNLATALGAARSDALYAQLVFLFLATPGVAIAALLTIAVAASMSIRRRQEQALLRARGASVRQLTWLAVVEAMSIGVVGGALGLGASVVLDASLLDDGSLGGSTRTTVTWSIIAFAAGLAIAAVGVAVPAWRDAHSVTVAGARRSVARDSGARWLRWAPDLWCIAGALLVRWLSTRDGYALVLAPEGVPTVSVSYWAFAAPAFLWVGAALLTVRVTRLVLSHGRRLRTGVLRPFAGALAPTVASVMGRDRRALARGAGFIALTVAFAVSTAVFNSTYRQQARVDAVLTNGADVRVTVPAGSDAQVGPALDALSGVRHVEPLQRRFAYVGSDLQDLFGVNPSTITTGTSLDDAYFSGGTAQEVIQRLAATPDGILVSAETVQDFQLRPGDALKLRLVTGTGDQYVEATFHYVGIAKEFPTAPRDSFLVANASYIAQASGRSAADTFLVTTDGTPPAVVAGRVRDVLGPAVQVTSLDTVQGAVGSSLVAVDLHGLTTLELALAVLLAAAGAGLTLWLAVHQRRRTLALAQVVGARPRQVTGLVAAEAGFVTVAGLLAGAALGWVLSNVLVDVLSGVFDPAPHQLAVPWAYLGAVMAAIVISVVAAVAATGRAAAAPPTALLRGS